MEPPKINLSQLLTFYCVAVEHSFTAAAKKLFLTESAVSQQVRNLEKYSGVSLIYNRKKKIYLSPVGQMLMTYAEEIYGAATKADNFIKQFNQYGLRVGVSTSLLSVIVPITTLYQELNPDIKLTLKHGATREMIARLLDQEYDVAVVIRSDYQTNKLSVVEISDSQRYALVTSCSNPLNQNKAVNFSDILDQTFIIPREGSAVVEILSKRFHSEGLEPEHLTVMPIDYFECTKMLVKMGKGIALMPEYEVQEDISLGRLKRLKLENDMHFSVDALVLAANADGYKPATMFIEMVKKYFEKVCDGKDIQNQ